jgi:hypothetical protein
MALDDRHPASDGWVLLTPGYCDRSQGDDGQARPLCPALSFGHSSCLFNDLPVLGQYPCSAQSSPPFVR